MAHIVTDDSFANDVLQSELPVLVDFYADWCGPCQMIGPMISKLAAEYEGKVKIVKCNVDDSIDTASSLGVQGIPAFKMFKNGEMIAELTGAKPETEVRAFIESHI